MLVLFQPKRNSDAKNEGTLVALMFFMLIACIGGFCCCCCFLKKCGLKGLFCPCCKLLDSAKGATANLAHKYAPGVRVDAKGNMHYYEPSPEELNAVAGVAADLLPGAVGKVTGKLGGGKIAKLGANKIIDKVAANTKYGGIGKEMIGKKSGRRKFGRKKKGAY